MDGSDQTGRVIGLLDQLGGAGEGQRLLDKLLAGGEELGYIARGIAGTPAFERLYKEARTLDIRPRGRKDADAAFVGIPTLDQGLPFEEQFRQFFKPRLGRRAEGFQALFDAVAARHGRPLIIETGCLRIPGNWEGDGQSSFMFDALVRDRHGQFFSIDLTPESIETARRACSSATHLICNDSVAALNALSQLARMPASLLYLDSFDLDELDPMPSAIHHAMELAAARPLIGPGTVVCVDDYGDSGGGKGLILDQFFSSLRTEVLHTGYQKAWVFA